MKKTTKRVLALLCALVVCLSMAACGGSAPASSGNAPASNGSAAAPTDGGSNYRKFVMAAPSDPGNYLPFNADNATRGTMQIFFYEQLFDLFGTGDMTPKIASGYERTAEGVYVVKIREGVYDHNGEAIKASDVVFSFEKPIEIGERASSLGEITSVKALDDYTVEFTFAPDLLGSFERAMLSSPIVSQKSYEASATGFSSDPVGTGPYYIADWTPGASITFKKDDNYWGKDLSFNNQNLDEIEVKFVAEPAQVAIELETGNIDFAYNISSKDADSFVGMPGFSVTNIPFAQVRGLGFNCDPMSPCSDVRIRQAICYAIDNAGILQSVYDGKGGVATCLAVPEPEAGLVIDFDQAWKNMKPYDFNLDKAKALMAEAGYPDGGLKLKLMAKDQDEYRSMTQVIQANLAKIGIEVEILCYENALYQTYRYQPDAFDFYCIGISNNGVPVVPVGWKWYVGKHSDTGANVLFQKDEKMEELLNAALDIEGHSNATVGALQDYILETCCMYPLVYTYTPYVHVDTISNLVFRDVFFYPHMSTISADFVSH
ncbi:MAG: ABC transporter substrate-binding protein [Clostridiales bacterium]|nr:ABC transporter substrate-binding protein [Clostridiales bacterium]